MNRQPSNLDAYLEQVGLSPEPDLGSEVETLKMLPYDETACKGCEGEMNRQVSVENGDKGECFVCVVSCRRRKG